MKKTIFLTLTLLIIAVCGISFAAGQIKALGNNVTIKETVLAGDKTAAEGITVTTKTKYREITSHKDIFWETDYTIGNPDEGNRIKSQVKVEKREEYRDDTVRTYLNMDDFYAGGYWTGYGDASYEDATVYAGFEGTIPRKMIDDIIKRTPAGGVYEDQIKMNAYVDFYPVELYGDCLNGDEIVEIAHANDIAYFQIPVPDIDVRLIKAEKDEQGNLTEMRIESMYRFLLKGSAVAFDNHAYLMLSDMHYWSEDDGIENSYPLPEGYSGIHCVPLSTDNEESVSYTDGENPTVRAWFKDAELLCSADKLSGAFRMVQGLNPEELLVFREEDGRVYMTVLDTTTKAVKQDLFLLNHKLVNEDFAYDEKVMTDGNHIIITFGTNKICAMESAQGRYQVIIADTLENLGILTTIDEHSAAFVFDEDKLYFAILSEKPKSEFVTGSSYHLLVYEKGKRVFTGFYENSLDYAAEFVEDGPTTTAVYAHPITLTLPSAASR